MTANLSNQFFFFLSKRDLQLHKYALKVKVIVVIIEKKNNCVKNKVGGHSVELLT